MVRRRDSRGRFMRESDWLAQFVSPTGARSFEEDEWEEEEEEEEEGFTIARFWSDNPFSRGAIRQPVDGEVLPDDAFDDPPSWAKRFQVRFKVQDNPRYPRNWASYETLEIDEYNWPPSHDWGKSLGGKIAVIIFTE